MSERISHLRLAPGAGFAAITPVMIAWGHATSAETFRRERFGHEPAELFEIPAETMHWLDRNPFIGGQEARIRATGLPVPQSLAA